jgi:hypothetical protein
MRTADRVRARREILDEVFQIVIFEFRYGCGVSFLRLIKFEEAVVHVTGGEAELFGRIIHQYLERIV